MIARLAFLAALLSALVVSRPAAAANYNVGTPIAATTGGATGTLPVGPTVVAQNVGAFPAYCQIGASASGITNGKLLTAGGGQWAITPAGATQVTCEGVGGTTTVNLIGTSGFVSDTGGVPASLVNIPASYTMLSPGQYNLAIVTSTALTVPSGATYAVVTAETANVRFTLDGTTTPTATVGKLLVAGASIGLVGADPISKFRAIAATAGATIGVDYAKQ